MDHKERAHLLSTVLPLLTAGARLNGFLGNADGWKWKSSFKPGRYLDLTAERVDVGPIMKGVTAWEEYAVEFVLDGPADANIENVRAAVKLAVSRLYDGPQVAPPAAELPQPKVALCTHGGCSELRTRGQLCESHAAREEEAAAEQAWRAARAKAFFKELEKLCAGNEFELAQRERKELSTRFFASSTDYGTPLVDRERSNGGGGGGGSGDGWVMVSPGPAGTFTIEAIHVNEDGQVTASAPVDPVVTAQSILCRLDRGKAARMADKTTTAPTEQNLPPLTEEEVKTIRRNGGEPNAFQRAALFPRNLMPEAAAGDTMSLALGFIGRVTCLTSGGVEVFFPPDSGSEDAT